MSIFAITLCHTASPLAREDTTAGSGTLGESSGRRRRFAQGRRRPRGRAQHDAHDVRPAVVHERDGGRVDGRAVELRLRHAADTVLGFVTVIS
jgi:hypothetical protein